MRTLNVRELDQVSGGCGQGSGNNDILAQNLAGAQSDMAEHGTPLPHRSPSVIESVLQSGADFLEALTHDLAGHLSAGVRDVADLLGRLF